MNKAFVREPDQTAEYCPRCGSKGEPVVAKTLAAHLTAEQRGRIAATANFCPSPPCAVAYFDGFERVVLAADLAEAVYPKDPAAPVCACFGLTRADIDQDVREGTVTRTKAALERARSADARCLEKAANGRSCAAHVQKYYMQCRQETASEDKPK
jgi:hypothetical protein